MDFIAVMTEFGFTVACVVGLAWFGYTTVRDVRLDAKEDKEKLYSIINDNAKTLEETRLVNMNVTATNEKLVDTVTFELKNVNTKLDLLLDSKED